MDTVTVLKCAILLSTNCLEVELGLVVVVMRYSGSYSHVLTSLLALHAVSGTRMQVSCSRKCAGCYPQLLCQMLVGRVLLSLVHRTAATSCVY